MTRTPKQDQGVEFMDDVMSINRARQMVLDSIARTISEIDHCLNKAVEMQAKVAAYDAELKPHVDGLLKTSVVSDLLTDMAAVKAAMVTYRDSHQGAR